MPRLAEILASLTGAWALFLFDRRGLERFNVSAVGFVRSFFAAVLLAPLYLWISLVQRDVAAALPLAESGDGLPSQGAVLAAVAIAYPFYWLAFPLAMVPIARLLDVRDRYVPFIVAFNWSNIIVVVIQAIPFGLFALGWLSAPSVQSGTLAAIIMVSVYRWYIARVALNVPAHTALGLVFIDLLLAILVAGLSSGALAQAHAE